MQDRYASEASLKKKKLVVFLIENLVRFAKDMSDMLCVLLSSFLLEKNWEEGR